MADDPRAARCPVCGAHGHPAWVHGATLISYSTTAPRWVPCGTCGGSGLVSGTVGGQTMLVACPACNGGGGRFEP